MKKTKMISTLALCAMALSTVSFTACEEIIEIVDPTVLEVTEVEDLTFTEVNTIQEIAFSSNMPWTLTSNEIWCKFVSEDGQESNTISGEAGNVKVKISVTDEGLTTETGDEQVEIEMLVDGQIQSFTTVYRLAQGYLLQVMDEDGNLKAWDECQLKVGYDDFIPFTVKSNFPFIIESFPKWVKFQHKIVGIAGELVTSALSLANSYEYRYPLPKSVENAAVVNEEVDPDTAGEIVFSNGKAADDETRKEFRIKVHYDGMPEDKIIIETPAFRKDWEVSMDGTGFQQLNTLNNGKSENVQKFDELKFSAHALNDKVHFVLFEKNGSKYEIKDQSWFEITGKEGEYVIKVQASDKAREGAVAVLPESIYEKNKTDLSGFFLKDGAFIFENYQKYVVAELLQGDYEIIEPIIFELHTKEGQKVDVKKLKDQDFLSTCTNLGIQPENFFYVDVPSTVPAQYQLKHEYNNGKPQLKYFDASQVESSVANITFSFMNKKASQLDILTLPEKTMVIVSRDIMGKSYGLVFFYKKA